MTPPSPERSSNGTAPPEHVDVLIVGAGLSGIGAAAHLQDAFPGRTYALLEAREASGGTWDLFRYPGIRSDSDMHTLGYRFRPWTAAKAIADGPSILEYVRDTARERGIDRHIRYHHRVVRAEWSTPDARWTVEAERTDTGDTVRFTCHFLFICGGYYRYDDPYLPEFEGLDRFEGQFFHAQKWPEGLDYAGKRVVVIGSGATAMTIVPAMAEEAEHVTMLQRSPTYVVSLPAIDPIAEFLRSKLPDRAAYFLIRWKNVLLQAFSYRLSRRRPELMKKLIRHGLERQLPPGFDIDKHFKPRYNPWDQRLCLVPDGDLFEALGKGTASIATDEVDSFSEHGIKLRSGEELPADIVVAATGLNLLALGGVELAVDGRDVEIPQKMAYKAMMLEGVPNMAFTVGYTNASWTLKADLTAEYVCRLLAYMDEHGHLQAKPELRDSTITEKPFLDFNAGYVMRSLHLFPKQGSKAPWQLRQNYPRDIKTLRHDPIDDGAMVFSSPSPSGAAKSVAAVSPPAPQPIR
jgi:cation diffusion facilitator CzcD-associated flavoprotein CzcO